MLFNSYVFIFVFLPVTLAGFYACGRFFSHWAALAWLTAASFVFYSWWDLRYLWLIGASILFNFGIGRLLSMPAVSGQRRAILTAGVTANLAAIAYFKYANFFLDTVNKMTGWPGELQHIVLPLGISFFTFTQIAFIVDAYRHEAAERSFLKYALFVTYFPHLIAGPIIHHRDVMPQFADPASSRWRNYRMAVGLTIFIIGLFKKMVLADTFSPYANVVFSMTERGVHPTLVTAWGAALCYTLQIYFDFSGYSDMAIGLSRLFGVQLPINFNSPYKSRSIVEFWRRWHISLSRFLRDYLYFALGGNRRGFLRRHANLFVTMLLGGLWHGAGWTFVIWGGLHGSYLICNHAWRGLRSKLPLRRSRLESGLGWAITFLAVVIAWVFFRATTPGAAIDMLRGAAGGYGVVAPDWFAAMLGTKAHWLTRLGMTLENGAPAFLPERRVVLEMLVGLVIAFCLPNTSQIMARYRPGIAIYDQPRPSWIAWKFSPLYAALAGCALILALGFLGQPADFIYFNF